jgi:prephenate dehydrogenase
MATQRSDPTVVVVGTGLIGTSIGLAARAAGEPVALRDLDAARMALAASLGAGVPMPPSSQGAGSSARAGVDSVRLVVVAVPPRATASVVVEQLRLFPNATVTHVSSVQALPQREVEASSVPSARFVGSHPIAGREVSGPVGASADLFRDRPWVICPAAASDETAVDAVAGFANLVGAQPVVLPAEEHDRLLARLSHVPQLVASALAASLQRLPNGRAALAGSGIRDTTRLADSSPQLWAQIVGANAREVSEALRAVAAPLLALADELGSASLDPSEAERLVAALVEQGRIGRSLLPGKHGRAATPLSVVQVSVPDEPGALARLLAEVAADGINLEDLRVEHAPGSPVGAALVSVAPADEARLVRSLAAHGWSAVPGGQAPL